MTHLQTLHAALTERRLLKVIAGIENFDRASVVAIARAAAAGGAQAVDIAADAALIQAVKAAAPQLVVFVSSTEPSKLVEAANAGADVLELGNYDALYRQDIHPTMAQILEWTKAVKAGAPNTPLCVTVSGHLPLAQQLELATELQNLGVDLLQTEGQVGPESEDTFAALSGAVSALGNTAEIRKVVTLPLLLAGGFNRISAPFAIAAGADALGVGKAVTRQADEASMAVEVRALVAALDGVQATGKGLARV
jgi:thiamine monophosphate synthase